MWPARTPSPAVWMILTSASLKKSTSCWPTLLPSVHCPHSATRWNQGSLSTCRPPSEAVETLRERLQQDSSPHTRTNFNPDQVRNLLHLCLPTTFFKYNEGFYRQKRGCHGFSSVPHRGLYMEEVEERVWTPSQNNSQPLGQICGGHMGQDQNSRIGAFTFLIKFIVNC